MAVQCLNTSVELVRRIEMLMLARELLNAPLKRLSCIHTQNVVCNSCTLRSIPLTKEKKKHINIAYLKTINLIVIPVILSKTQMAGIDVKLICCGKCSPLAQC